MDAEKIREGLWRWSAPHPAWTPGSNWNRVVASYYYEPSRGDAVVLFDPLAPPDGTPEAGRFWSALDRDVERLGRPVAVLVGVHHHSRSAGAVAARYGGSPGVRIWALAGSEDRIASCTITDPFRPGDPLPGGVAAFEVAGLDGPEVVYHVPEHRGIVAADALLDHGDGEVRVAPESWAEKTEAGRARYRESFRASLEPLRSLDLDLVLLSHSRGVWEGGSRTLARALDGPEWSL